MLFSLRRSSGGGAAAAALILLVLCCAEWTDAVPPLTDQLQADQHQHQDQLQQQDATVSGTLEVLLTLFNSAVQEASREVVAGVDGRLTEVQTELKTLQTELKTELKAELASQNGQLAAQNDNLTLQLDGVETELSAQNTQLSEMSAQLSDLSTAQTAELSRVREELRAVQSQLEKLPATLPRDCSDLPAGTASGVHLLQPGLRQPAPAYCDMDTDGGGWTVFQRRADIQPRQDFFLGWEEYKRGFGELDVEFWWGLELLWLTTSQLDRRYELRVDLEDFEGGKKHALYQGFRISPEKDNYRLTAVNYTGDAGDSLGGHTGHPFSTKDRDNDIYGPSCAVQFNGAWWYTKCHSSNLNGLYLSGQHSSYANGVNWRQWKGYNYSLKTVSMKIRPTKKL